MTAMAPVTKFTFDLDFDAPEDSLQPELVEEEVEVVEEEVAPTFSEEELAQARDEGFKAGKEEGRKEFAEATEQRILEAMDSVSENLANIFSEQAQANQDIAKEMIQISTAIAKKMFPDLNARNALGEVERVVQDTLKAITDEPRVQIMVHPDLREPLTDRLTAMTQRTGFDGKVYVNPDNTVNLGDCRVEWSHGAAVRDSDTIMEQIDEIIERNLHGKEDKPDVTDADAPVEGQSDNQANDEPDDSGAEVEATETDGIALSEPEDLESTADDAQAQHHEDPTSSIENLVEDIDNTPPTDVVDEEIDIDRDHFEPNANIDDDISTQSSGPEIQENQHVEPDIGEAPIPHIDLEQDQASGEQTESTDDPQETADDPGRTVNSDPVSPDMTAAILDAQGALSEEDEK
mgnify:CR=1 FL=1